MDLSDWIFDSIDDCDNEFVVHEDYGQQEACDYLEEHLVQPLAEGFNFLQNRYKIPDLQDNIDICKRENFPEEIHSIRSMVGDDETTTTTCLLYPILALLIGWKFTGIKISWEDVGFNQDFYNYAEGWVFLPPSADSSFEAVNRYARGSAVPFVLDPVKFRNLSAVRKQSEMDRDLPSKFQNIAEAANWTNSEWFTWDLHQFSLILANESFDFVRSKLFPYLFATEGGCGGAPPWGNIHTAAGMIMRYRRGHAKVGILGVMQDSIDLFRGAISPQDSFFVKNLYLAISGDKRWEEVKSFYLDLEQDAEIYGFEPQFKVDQAAEELIPEELMAVSTMIRPEDPLTGTAISFLREKGYVMTELDVVMEVESQKKFDAIWGTTCLRDVGDQIELRKQEYKEAFLGVLTDLAVRETNPRVRERIDKIKDPFDPEMISLMEAYYNMRLEQGRTFTSFIYNDRIRIFKKEDVLAYFDRKTSGLRDDFSASVSYFYRPEHRRTIEYPDETEKFDRIEAWLNTGPLDLLLRKSLPAGIGPDDARIARNIKLAIENQPLWDGYLVVVITNDKKMVNGLHHVMRHDYPRMPVRILQLRIHDYLKCCLQDNTWVVRAKVRTQFVKEQKGRFHNVISGQQEDVKMPLLGLLDQEGQYLWNCKFPKLMFEYDVPNINRTCANFRLDNSGSYVTELTSGCLSGAYLKSNPGFSCLPLHAVKLLPEFLLSRRRSIFKTDKIKNTPISSYSPGLQTGRSSYRW